MPSFDFDALRKQLELKYGTISDTDLSTAAQYPEVFAEYMSVVEKYGDLSILPTRLFLHPMHVNQECSIVIEDGKTLIV